MGCTESSEDKQETMLLQMQELEAQQAKVAGLLRAIAEKCLAGGGKMSAVDQSQLETHRQTDTILGAQIQALRIKISHLQRTDLMTELERTMRDAAPADTAIDTKADTERMLVKLQLAEAEAGGLDRMPENDTSRFEANKHLLMAYSSHGPADTVIPERPESPDGRTEQEDDALLGTGPVSLESDVTNEPPPSVKQRPVRRAQRSVVLT
jgi:hypothetical protein